MLVLSRRINESIWIGDEIQVSVLRIGPTTIRLGVTAPDHMNIRRDELDGSLHVQQERNPESSDSGHVSSRAQSVQGKNLPMSET